MTSRLKDTILIVGGPDSDRASLRTIFESTFDLLEAESATQAAMLLAQNIECISIVLADIPLEDAENIRHLAEVAKSGGSSEVPFVLFITPSGTGIREETAFSLGATDVVYKPYTSAAVQRRIQIISDFFLHQGSLEAIVAEQRETIRNSNQIMLDAMSAIIEHRSTESGNHVLRIRRFTKILLEEVAACCPQYGLTSEMIENITAASALHDIGKISIPDAILNKPGALTTEEFEIMKSHSAVGGEFILTLAGSGDEDYLRYAYNIARYHHERWDGRGYPDRLVGDEIPICAQVVGIADAFDALTTDRVYKPAIAHQAAINMILNGECGAFSPSLLECFKRVRGSFVELARQYADGYSPKSDNIAIPLPGPVWHKPKLDSLQLSQVKYQTLLHYTNDTVIEFDIDSNVYHIVYNPNPEFESILGGATYDDAARFLLASGVHPEDAHVLDELRSYFVSEFFEHDLRRKSLRCRLYSPRQGQYVLYDISLLRVNTQNSEQRIVIAVFHKVKDGETLVEAALPETLHAAPALYGLVSSAIRCNSDADMTIDAGAGDLHQLTGYTEAEIKSLFGGKYIDLIHPDDRESFSHAVMGIANTGGRTETEYRLLHKDGRTVWALDKSRAYIESDGREYIYHAIRDNSTAKAAQHRMQATIERNQIIVDQSGGIVFEWDLLSDTMYCSPKWEERFGYTPVSRNYGSQMGIATHFHPDDLPVVRSAISQLRSGDDALNIDVRIADSNAKYLWTRIAATACYDEFGRLDRIIGLLQDIDAQKRAELALKDRAEHDSLTKLYNKMSTQQLTAEYLAQRSNDVLAAMLVIDLDNFKLINDNYGHLYGDAVLSQMGTELKKLFRTYDIVGRIGGDEFLVFMKDIPNADLVHSRCEMLLNICRQIMERSAPGLNVSCSVGAAIAPYHGTDYTELFSHADEALYAAKGLGKDTYTVYDPAETGFIDLKDLSQLSTRIDSDEEPGMADSSFVRFVFRRLYESRDITATINDILAYAGEQMRVSRVYIFENNDDNTTCSNTFEWCGEGIEPQIDVLQDVSYITDVPGWPDVFDERGIFYCTDIKSLAPQFRAILEPQGIKSMLQCSIRDNGVFRGYVGFDECTVNRLWTQDQIDLLQFLAEVLSMFLLKHRAQNKIENMAAGLRTILDTQDAWIYVIDPDTCELKFLNARTKSLAPHSREGMTCYGAFMGRETRCENCPSENFREKKIGTAVINNPNLGVRVLAHASEITWNGEKSCLMTCYDLAGTQE